MTGTIAFYVFIGIFAVTLFNHIRWAIFPMSGGPVGINRWFGGPPDDKRRGTLVATRMDDGEDMGYMGYPASMRRPRQVTPEEVKKRQERAMEVVKLQRQGDQLTTFAINVYLHRQIFGKREESGFNGMRPVTLDEAFAMARAFMEANEKARADIDAKIKERDEEEGEPYLGAD